MHIETKNLKPQKLSWSQRKELENSMAAQRERTDTLNDIALGRLLLQHNVQLPREKGARWRPTLPTAGDHPVWPDRTLKCIATDGLLAVFLDYEKRVFIGHIDYFEWKEERELKIPVVDEETGEERVVTVKQRSGAPPPLHSAPRKISVAEKKKTETKKAKVQSALELAKEALGL